MTKVQRYKVGYYTDEWGMLIIAPRLLPDDSGYAVKFEDYCKLETELAAKDEVIAEAGEMLAMRDRQLAALKTELREICATIDYPACDLTLTTVECIKKLKAENDGLKRDAARYQWLKSQEPSKHDGYAIGYFDACGVDAWRMTTKDLDQTIDAAMAQGEK